MPSPIGTTDPAAPSAARALCTGEQLLAWRREQLRRGGRTADLDWLLDLAGGLRWQALQQARLHPDRTFRLERSLAELERIWRRHLSRHEPLQYLVGVCPWRDLELRVAPGVLIPRQETETLVDLALALLPQPPQRQEIHWADLGTGSGCLATALARCLPRSHGLAVDLSAEALRQAAINLQAAGVASRVGLLQGSWWEPLRPWRGQLSLVLANPPYIPSALLPTLEPVVREHEPRLALDGGADGLDALRRIIEGAGSALAPAGWLVLEHHHDQSPAVLDLLRQAGFVDVAAAADLEGVARFARARLSSESPLRPHVPC